MIIVDWQSILHQSIILKFIIPTNNNKMVHKILLPWATGLHVSTANKNKYSAWNKNKKHWNWKDDPCTLFNLNIFLLQLYKYMCSYEFILVSQRCTKLLNARTDFHNDFYHCNKYIYITALDDTLRYKVYKKSSFFINIRI